MLLLPLFLTAALFASSAKEGAQAANASEQDLTTTLFNDFTRSVPFYEEQPSSNTLSPYEARPRVPHTITENQRAARRWLDEKNVMTAHGIDFSVNYTSDIAGNPVGGFRPGGCTYADVIAVACLLDTEKLIKWHGGYFTISAMELNGNDLTQQNVGNIFFVEQAYAVETIHFNELSYEQKFLDDRASIKFGRIVAGNEFATSPLYYLYMNAGIDGNPEAVWLNGKLSSYFNAVWGSRLKVELPASTVARLGIYQVTPFSRNGVNWNIYPNNGAMLLAQYGWNPEFGKPSCSQQPDKSEECSNEKTADPFSCSSKGISVSKGLAGHYWMGGYYSTAEYPQFNSTIPAANAYGLYWHADQTVYKPDPNTNEGLILWSAYALCPQENISQLPFQVNGGAVYTGLIPGRRNDFTIFGVIYGDFSSNYASVEQQNGNGYPTYELVYESGYRIHLTDFSYIQPDLQWIIHPGGTGNIPNALVIGAQVGVVF